MNQDQVKDLLLRLEPNVPEFAVTFTGKSSRKVNGLYKPESREILLHNKNFASAEELVYTAVHEFAHHVHLCSAAPPNAARCHTKAFWLIFHDLLDRAIAAGLYRNTFDTEPEFQRLTLENREGWLKEIGLLTKSLGQGLLNAVALCGKHHVRFEDYMDRVLGISRSTAKLAMTAFAHDVAPDGGIDQIKAAVELKDPEARRELEAAAGSLVQKRAAAAGAAPLKPDPDAAPVAPREQLRQKLEAELARLKEQVEKVTNKLKDLNEETSLAAAHPKHEQLWLFTGDG